MQRETVAPLMIVAIRPVRLMPVLLLPASGDERRQAIDVAALLVARGALLLAPSMGFALRIELRITRQIGLWLAGAERVLLAAAVTERFLFAVLECVLTRVGS